ncbi:porin family protein [Chryseobacterium sp. SNU WT5]|uniref:outer membrane beta-barrel protein n=1 Tax=Chryseobacterium sp. SNU WT5 TaxID=2594269 RepID=UPI00117FCA73|nr:outer membrane beta-barrel protein [Chryseobacterium sp. SNU WT5]QDP86376.1 porin family protein [Chryseobacterium sp. SNU WT5]
MKKLLITGAVALLGITAQAQLQKGNWMVGSQVANVKFTNGFSMNLTPNLAYFVQDRWAVGAQVGLNVVSPQGTSATQTDWSIAPFTRYYFTSNEIDNLLNNGAFFAEGSAGFGGNNSSTGSSTNGVDLGIGAGYAYFITPSVGLEALLKYKGLVGGGNTTAQGNLYLGVGFQIYLPNSKAKAALRDNQ